MRAVGYYRPPSGSPRADADAAGRIEAYCREEGHTLLLIVGPSAGATGDEQYAALRDALEGMGRGGALVVISDVRHLASDLAVLVGRLIDLDAAGGEVRCADDERPDPIQNGLDTLGFAGRSPARARRIRESVMSKASRGEVLGRTPFGYEGALDGTMRILPPEAATVRRIFGLYAGPEPAGDDDQATPAGGPGLRRIAATLNAEGLRTRAGHPWTPVAVAGILRNRAYVGSYSRYGMRIVGNHERIVDRRLFNRARDVLRARRPQRQRRRASTYLLGGFGRCGVCGRGMHGLTRARSWRRADGTLRQRSYRYYECPSRAGRGRAGDQPEHPAWRADPLEDEVRRQLSLVPEASLLASFRPRQVELAIERLHRVERDFLMAVREAARGRRGLAGLVEPLAALQEARAGRGATPVAPCGPAEALADLDAGVPASARRALEALLDRVVVFPDRVELVLRPPERG